MTISMHCRHWDHYGQQALKLIGHPWREEHRAGGYRFLLIRSTERNIDFGDLLQAPRRSLPPARTRSSISDRACIDLKTCPLPRLP